jgi:hypothetical protein
MALATWTGNSPQGRERGRMARQKSHLERLLNLKPAAYAGFRGLTALYPRTRHWLGFYPEIGPLPDRIEGVAESLDYRIRLADPRFKPQIEALALHDWDVHRPAILNRDPFVSQRFIGIVRDVIVPGHRLTPVDPATWAQIAFGQRGASNWNFARPAPTILKSRRVAEPALVVPPFWNYWHLFLEHLLPLIQAARLNAWGDRPLAIVTRRERPPLIDAVLRGLEAVEGVSFRIVEALPSEHLRLDRMLVAVNQCWNVERSYALAEAIPTARQVFAASYREHPKLAAGPRLYISRRGVKLRQMTNEDEIIAGLERRGFRVLQAKWDNHHDQLAAFANAEIVVGVHGAGLTNIIFASPGTKVLEIFPFDHRKTAMLHLSAEHDLVHRPFFGSLERFNQAFSLDPKAFFADLDPLL